MWCHKLLFQPLPHLYLVFLKASLLEECTCTEFTGSQPFMSWLDRAFPIQHSHSTLYFQDLLSFFPPPHFRTQPPVLQGSSPALRPSAWWGQQAAHRGHGLGMNFLFPPALRPEVIAKLMGYLSSKFSNKALQLVRIIQPQLALVWSQALPRMSLPGPVQKLQSF